MLFVSLNMFLRPSVVKIQIYFILFSCCVEFLLKNLTHFVLNKSSLYVLNNCLSVNVSAKYPSTLLGGCPLLSSFLFFSGSLPEFVPWASIVLWSPEFFHYSRAPPYGVVSHPWSWWRLNFISSCSRGARKLVSWASGSRGGIVFFSQVVRPVCLWWHH